MNALAEMPIAARGAIASATLAPPRSRGAYVTALCAALGIHAAILFAWPPPAPVPEPVEFAVEMADASVEVALVAALPAEDPAPTVESPPEPMPPTEPEPLPIAEQPAVETPPLAEMTRPEPTPPIPPESPRPEPPKAQPKPRPPVRAARAAGNGSSAIPGHNETTATASAGAVSTQVGYLRNPHPAYPEAARAARQEGVVSLAVKVDARGSVIAVRVSRSSGFPLLDERARSTVSQRWKFRPAKVGGTAVATEVTIPIRFTLER